MDYPVSPAYHNIPALLAIVHFLSTSKMHVITILKTFMLLE